VGLIDLKLMFEGSITYNLGYCIHHVKQDDMFILNAAQRENNNWVQKRRDAIQITFKDQALIWDLGKNAEVQTLNAPQQFSDSGSYVRTGFLYYRKINMDSKFSISNCRFLQSNSQESYITSPKTEF
jgi:hypothetical protein